MKIEIDLYHPDEMTAFAAFLNAAAAARLKQQADDMKHYDAGGTGLGNVMTAEAALKAAEAQKAAETAKPSEDAKIVTNTERPSDKPNSRSRTKKDEPKGNISTQPEDRKDPATSEADQAQDKADEQAESNAGKTAAVVKHDDVRGALGDYVKAFGMPAALEDGPKVLAMVLGDKPDKTDWKISEIPEDQDKLSKIVGGINEMTEKNPFKRDAVKAA